MRPIDADSLLVNMDKGIQGTAREYLKYFQMAVNDEPTAYDIDKCMERLEERATDNRRMALLSGDKEFSYREDEDMKAIEIVKEEIQN